jgi:hypothetical protein
MLLLDDLQQLQPVEPRTLQPDIKEDQMRPARADQHQRLVRAAGRPGAVAFVREDTRHQLADVAFVVDDENVRCHAILKLSG